MADRRSVQSAPATPSDRAELLALIRDELGDRSDRIMRLLGLTWSQFEEIYESRGEVRTLKRDSVVAGYLWIERRGRELHLHAIFVLPEQRGRGIGSAALCGLEHEYQEDVDVIELGVEQDNSRARSLYERHGFRVEQTLPDLGFDIMRKHLSQVV